MRYWGWLSGVLAMMVSAGCAAPGEDVGQDAEDLSSSCGSAIGDRVAAAALKGKRPMADAALTSRGNRVLGGPVIGGEAIIDEIERLMLTAQHEVMIEFFDIETGSYLGKRLREAIQKLPSNVTVYLLVNPDQHKRFFGYLAQKPKARVQEMNAFFADSRVKVAAWNGARWLDQLHVMHTKQVVVDGQRAFVTDTNLQANSDPTSEGGRGWNQMGVSVEGEVAAGLRAEMIDAFQDSTPHLAIDTAVRPVRVDACTSMTVLTRGAGAGEDASANLAYEEMFRAARSNVNVMTPNLNDDHALSALSDATADSEVNIILSKGFNDATESYVGQGGTNAHNVTRLANMAKNQCNLHIRWFSQEQDRAVNGNGGGASHAKWASVDGTAMILGSQNLDTQSWKQSRELNVFIDDRTTTHKFDTVFAAQWSKGEVAFENSCR